ncbi:MAG: thiol reductant ABC exporter subunit CydD [Bacillus sp. (in: firmicutes)]
MTKRLWQLKGLKRTMLFLAVIAVSQGIAIITQAFFLAMAIDHLFHGESLRQQLFPILSFTGAYMLRYFLSFFRDRWMERYTAVSGNRIRGQLLEILFAAGPSFIRQAGTGKLVTMIVEGITQAENYIKLCLPKILNLICIPSLVVLYMLKTDLTSGIICTLVVPVLIFFMVLLGIAARRKANRQYSSHQRLSNHFVDSLRGLETLRLLGLGKHYDRNIMTVSEQYRSSTMGTLRVAFLSTFALDFFTSLSIAVIALFLGIRLLEGSMELFPALTVLILAPEFFLPIREFGMDYHATLNGKNSLEAIYEITDTELPGQPEASGMDTWTEKSAIALRKLSYKYERASDDSLKEIDFCWRGYGKIGIIGGSGSGKSTLINILAGFLQPHGECIQINGKHIEGLHDSDWQNSVLYIPQHPYIFNDTLRNNIAFYTPDATAGQIWDAIDKAGLREVVDSLPHGLEEIIGESGRSLSGGQEQRIALARGFLDDRRQILLFDEPTAHLDIETEYELKQRMLPMFQNKLVFFATHRLHWMKEMDYILVLENGTLVESGKPDDLLAKKGKYWEFIRQQSNNQEVHYA